MNSADNKADIGFIRAMPKIELHVHLEGAVQPGVLLKLAEKNNIPLPCSNIDDLKKWYTFEDFGKFLEVYFKICQCIKSADDIEYILREFLKGQKEQNIIYSEITYTAYAHYLQHSIKIEDQIAALNRAKEWGISELGVDCNFILDIPRDRSPEEGLHTAEWVCKYSDRSVIALGLGGDERNYPPSRHAVSFAGVRDENIAAIPHAGETLGPESVWEALEICSPRRIGHGVRAIEDEKLVEYLAENEIAIEVCPSSNICLKVYKTMREHPLPLLAEKGVKVTINSDDPAIFGVSLTEEFARIKEAFGFSGNDIRGFLLNAAEAAIVSEEKRKFLSGTINSYFQC